MKRVVIGLMGRVRVSKNSKNNPELGRNSRRTPPESGFSWIRPMSIEIRLSSGELYIPAKLSFDSVFQPYTFPWSQQTRIQQQLTPCSSCSSIPTNSDSNAGEPKARRLSKRLKTYPTSDKQSTNIIQASNNNSIQQIIKKQTGKWRRKGGGHFPASTKTNTNTYKTHMYRLEMEWSINIQPQNSWTVNKN